MLSPMAIQRTSMMLNLMGRTDCRRTRVNDLKWL